MPDTERPCLGVIVHTASASVTLQCPGCLFGFKVHGGELKNLGFASVSLCIQAQHQLPCNVPDQVLTITTS